MKAGRDVELSWTNKDKRLKSDGDVSYEWNSSDTGDYIQDPTLEHLASIGTDTSTQSANLMVIGDALDALNALKSGRLSPVAGERTFAIDEGVRLVYIDPPFNTGNKFAQYTDSLRHSMWLSMLRDRLEAVKPLLSPLASIWVHLDDRETHHGRCLLDELFGSDAFVATIIWQKRTTRESRSAFSNNHDYIHVYAPAGPKVWKEVRNLVPRKERAFRNRDGDRRGPWTDAPFTAPGYRPNQHYPIVNPAGNVLSPPKGRSWYATEPAYRKLLDENRIWFPKNGAGRPRLKLFPSEVKGVVPFSIWGPDDAGTNDDAKRHLMSMFPGIEPFATPKPETLLQRIIHIGSDPGDLVLDFFAGAGTTSAAAHKSGRRWITVERSAETVNSFSRPRMEKVVTGEDPYGVTQLLAWQGGGSFSVLRACPAISNAERKNSTKQISVASSGVSLEATSTNKVGETPSLLTLDCGSS